MVFNFKMSNEVEVSSSEDEISTQSSIVYDEGEGEVIPIRINVNNNQLRKDFPQGVRGVNGTWHRRNQVEFELEGAEPMGTRNVPRCLAADFEETEFRRPDAFRPGVLGFRPFYKASKNLDKAGDIGNAGDAFETTDDGKPILLHVGKTEKDGGMTAAQSLHALLDKCYSAPDPKHRRKCVQKFRDEHPLIYQEHFGDDVANDTITSAAPKTKSKTSRRRCQIQ